MKRFLEDLEEEIEQIMARYPTRRSGLIPLLWAVQNHMGYVPDDAFEEIAQCAEVTTIQVEEVVTFYTMFHRRPMGKFVLQVCKTLPCALCGGLGLSAYLQEKLGVGLNEVTPDGVFSIQQVECLGACSEAPLMLVNKKLETKLTREKVDQIIEWCRSGAGTETETQQAS